MQIPINIITESSFEKYGHVIDYNKDNPKNFQVLLIEHDTVGWRIAVSRTENRSVKKLARHPDSMESFEPISGVPLICVAVPEHPDKVEVFLLDKPICLFKNIWHAMISLSESSLLKITENKVVSSEEFELNAEILYNE